MKVKVTAVNMPKGTITLMWGGDPTKEWNYNIPLHEDGSPFSVDEALQSVVSNETDRIMYEEAITVADFSAFDSLLHKDIDLSERYKVERAKRQAAPERLA
jgi:hypothetical protein